MQLVLPYRNASIKFQVWSDVVWENSRFPHKTTAQVTHGNQLAALFHKAYFNCWVWPAFFAVLIVWSIHTEVSQPPLSLHYPPSHLIIHLSSLEQHPKVPSDLHNLTQQTHQNAKGSKCLLHPHKPHQAQAQGPEQCISTVNPLFQTSLVCIDFSWCTPPLVVLLLRCKSHLWFWHLQILKYRTWVIDLFLVQE